MHLRSGVAVRCAQNHLLTAYPCPGADQPTRFRHDLFPNTYEVAGDDRRFGAVQFQNNRFR